MYRQRLPGAELSIEAGTPDVPNDGRYYVLLSGTIKGRFRSLQQALRCYQTVRKSLNLPPPSPVEPPGPEEVWRRDMDSMSNKSLLWNDEDFARVDRKTRGRPKH